MAHDKLPNEIKNNPLLFTTWKGWCKLRSNWQTSPRFSSLLYVTQNYRTVTLMQSFIDVLAGHTINKGYISKKKGCSRCQNYRNTLIPSSPSLPIFKPKVILILPQLADRDWTEVIINWFSIPPNTKGVIIKIVLPGNDPNGLRKFMCSAYKVDN